MALDHYVSQVHLRRFCAPDGLLHAIRKSDLKQFTPRPRDVCRLDEGSTNNYLTDPRIIEEFLKTIEGKYNAATDVLERGKPDQETVYVIAGFLSYVLSCSPTAMRLNSGPLKGSVEMVAKLLEKRGELPPPPAILGGEALAEMLDTGKLRIKVDEKYPQAIGIANILRHVAFFGNTHWDVLINEHAECPFFTSDYPIAFESTNHPLVTYRVMPLSPNVAFRVAPDREQKDRTFDFRNFSFERRKLTRGEACNINRLLVQSAEDTVLFREDQRWVNAFVKKHRHFRVETAHSQIPKPGGTLQIFQQMIAPFARE